MFLCFGYVLVLCICICTLHVHLYFEEQHGKVLNLRAHVSNACPDQSFIGDVVIRQLVIVPW